METDKKIIERLLDIESGYEVVEIQQSIVEVKPTANNLKYGKATYSQVEIFLRLRSDWAVPEGSKIHSWETRRWRHLDLFEHQCYLICDLPILKEERSGKLKQLPIDFSRPNSGFTLKMEYRFLELIQESNNINAVGRFFGEYPQRIQHVFDQHIGTQLSSHIVKASKKIGIDETNRKKGHDYVTVFVDLEAEKPRILNIEEGKG
jgi:transposase